MLGLPVTLNVPTRLSLGSQMTGNRQPCFCTKAWPALLRGVVDVDADEPDLAPVLGGESG